MRCFISIDFPENIKKEIRKIQEQLPNFIGKKTEKENLHLTLKFLGEIDKEKTGSFLINSSGNQIKEKIKLIKEKLKEIKIAKFESEINGIGVFSEKVIRIVWLHLTNCDVLQKEIDKSLKGLFEPEQRFMSHLTIARVKSVKNKREFLEKLNKIKISKIKFVVNNFKLKNSILKSEGPVYEDTEKYKLE